MSEHIRVDDETYATLEALKGGDESFDDVLSRLVERRRSAVRRGAGLWTDTDAADHARTARVGMKRTVRSDSSSRR